MNATHLKMACGLNGLPPSRAFSIEGLQASREATHRGTVALLGFFRFEGLLSVNCSIMTGRILEKHTVGHRHGRAASGEV